MRAKVLSVIVVIICFVVLMGVAFAALPTKAELSGFWDWFCHIVNVELVCIGTTVSGLFTIKWVLK